MPSKLHKKVLIIFSALLLAGGGCLSLSPFDKVTDEVESGDTVSEQADIIVDDLLKGAEDEDQALLEESGDAALYDLDEEELNNYDQVYDENEL